MGRVLQFGKSYLDVSTIPATWNNAENVKERALVIIRVASLFSGIIPLIIGTLTLTDWILSRYFFGKKIEVVTEPVVYDLSSLEPMSFRTVFEYNEKIQQNANPLDNLAYIDCICLFFNSQSLQRNIDSAYYIALGIQSHILATPSKIPSENEQRALSLVPILDFYIHKDYLSDAMNILQTIQTLLSDPASSEQKKVIYGYIVVILQNIKEEDFDFFTSLQPEIIDEIVDVTGIS